MCVGPVGLISLHYTHLEIHITTDALRISYTMNIIMLYDSAVPFKLRLPSGHLHELSYAHLRKLIDGYNIES